MTHSYTAQDFSTVTPFIMVNGAGPLLDFMTQALDAVIVRVLHQKDGTVWHAQVKMGQSMVMVADSMGGEPRPGTLYLYLPDCDAVYDRALKHGATSLQEPRDQFYGDRVCGVMDTFGNMWWFATHIEDVTDDEMKRRAAEVEKT